MCLPLVKWDATPHTTFQTDFPALGRHYDYSIRVPDDLYLHRGKEQLSSRKHLDPEVCVKRAA
jgi:hypothetical protein